MSDKRKKISLEDVNLLRGGDAHHLRLMKELSDLKAEVNALQTELERAVSHAKHGLALETRYAEQRNTADAKVIKLKAEMKRLTRTCCGGHNFQCSRCSGAL